MLEWIAIESANTRNAIVSNGKKQRFTWCGRPVPASAPLPCETSPEAVALFVVGDAIRGAGLGWTPFSNQQELKISYGMRV
jgi:hypothetical protein